MRILKAAVAWLLSLFGWPWGRWRFVNADDLPPSLRRRRVYMIGEEEHVWQLAFLCPCGCGEMIQLCTLPGSRPRWSYFTHDDRTLTIHPSVNRTRGCRSHFWLRNGRVIWCG